MDKIKIHVLRTGEVRVSPYLPFGGDNCSIIKASGLTTPKKDWIWLPVFSYLIEHPKGEGLCALKIRNAEGKYVLLFADGGYATKSWRDMITSGITLDKTLQRQSLQWIREQSLSPDCIASLATHDTEVHPHVIEL